MSDPTQANILAEFEALVRKITDPAYQAEVERRVFSKLQRAFKANLPSYRPPSPIF